VNCGIIIASTKANLGLPTPRPYSRNSTAVSNPAHFDFNDPSADIGTEQYRNDHRLRCSSLLLLGDEKLHTTIPVCLHGMGDKRWCPRPFCVRRTDFVKNTKYRDESKTTMHYTSKHGICRYLRRQCTPVCRPPRRAGASIDFSVRDNPHNHVLVSILSKVRERRGPAELLLLSVRCSVIASILGDGKRSVSQHRGEASLLITTQCFAHLLCRSIATKPFLSELPQPILNPFHQAAGSPNRISTKRKSLSPPF
jgi:hypothetical protein